MGKHALASLRDEHQVRGREQDAGDRVPDDDGRVRQSVRAQDERVPRSSARMRTSVATRLNASSNV